MKKFFALMLVASAFITASASAQTASSSPARLKGRNGAEKQMLVDSLKLSDAAADSVIAIRMQSKMQMKTIMNDESLSQDQKKEKMKPIKQDMKTKMEKYLSKDQMMKLQEMQGGMRKGKSEE